MAAVGNPDMIRGMRRGRSPTADRLRALCDVLDLEFYVGAPAGARSVGRASHGAGCRDRERGVAASGQALSHADKARFVIAVYQLIGEHGPANAARVRQLLRMVSGGDRGSQSDTPVGDQG